MKRLAGLLLVVLALGGIVVAQNALLINGAGATFPYPIYSKWFDEFHKTNGNIQINYQSVGSGAGIKQATDGTVDFGASDGPMNDEQLKAYSDKHGSGILHFPTVLGAVVPTYNIAGVSADLNFTPEALAGIFLGKITSGTTRPLPTRIKASSFLLRTSSSCIARMAAERLTAGPTISPKSATNGRPRLAKGAP